MVPAILLAGVALRVQTFTRPWTGVHNAWGGAFYGNVARNLVRYGFVATAGGPVVNSGVVDPSQFEIYYHHPVLSVWFTAASFQLFGIHEWSARLAPLVFSVLTMGLVLVFARSVFGDATALIATLFMAVLPVDAYYATHLDPYSSMAIFFTALAVDAYRRWLLSSRDRHFALCVTAIMLGCLTAWYTYLVIPPIFAHFWLLHRGPKSRAMWIRVWSLPALAVALFGLFLLHRSIALAGHAEVYDSLSDRLLKRTTELPSSRVVIFKTYLRAILTLYTLPFVALMAAWVLLFVNDLRTRRLRGTEWFIVILLSYGLLYGLAFPGHLLSHDYFTRSYAPGVALACAVVVMRLAAALRQPLLRFAVVGGTIAAVCVVATMTTQRLYAADDDRNPLLLKGFGEVIAGLSTPRDAVLMPTGEDRVLQYYVDRPMTFALDTPVKMQAAASGAKGAYLIAIPERSATRFAELIAHLEQRYTLRKERGLMVFVPASEPRR